MKVGLVGEVVVGEVVVGEVVVGWWEPLVAVVFVDIFVVKFESRALCEASLFLSV